MAEYTVVKVADVPDQGPRFGLEGDYEVRFLRNDLRCEHCGVTYMRLAPNFRQPFGHRHKVQEEIYVLVNGSARVKAGDDVVELEAWTAIRCPNETIRSFEAGPAGAEFVAVGAPNTGPGDAITERGWWGDSTSRRTGDGSP
jgi:mannose-6-phosphate isomerase-like protein (cupin superfamily)